MPKIIQSVEVVHLEGTDSFGIGDEVYPSNGIIDDIIENDGRFLFYDERDELIMEIRDCPVIVRYSEESVELPVKPFKVGDVVTWRLNNGFRVIGSVTGIESDILVVKSDGYLGGDDWRVDPNVFEVSRKEG